VATSFTAWVRGCSLVPVAGSNPYVSMDVKSKLLPIPTVWLKQSSLQNVSIRRNYTSNGGFTKKTGHPLKNKYNTAINFILADPAGRTVQRLGQRLFVWSKSGFEFRREHGCLSVVSLCVCCPAGVFAKGRYLVQRSSTECVCVCVCVCARARARLFRCNTNTLYLKW
jgi:hypothetical protein